ncbi:MAG: hypothetical protein K0Q63_920 [Paenibacillus sp.]|nr:hypothetical protein [Paenibacillus sp.]
MDKRWRMDRWIGATALVLLLAGCQDAAPPGGGSGNTALLTEEITSDGPQKSYLEEQGAEAAGGNAPSGSPGTLGGGSDAETSSVKKDGNGKPAEDGAKDGGAWDKKLPALHGIAIGDKESSVASLLGKELDSYVLEEESTRIRVAEYDGLSIGFNAKGGVHFVEVYGSETSSGLSGIMIGDHPDQALKKLGKPQSQSEFLLTYQAQGAWLKLDIDPGANEIVSMKLIAST